MGVSSERKASAPVARPMSKTIYIILLGLCTFRFDTLCLISDEIKINNDKKLGLQIGYHHYQKTSHSINKKFTDALVLGYGWIVGGLPVVFA